MKSLSLSRPLVIMLVGVPGAGKSFFARQFSDVFSAPLVSFDEIRHTLFNEPFFTRDEETLVAHVMRTQIVQLLKTGKTIIIDGGLNTRMARLAIERLARRHDYGSMVVWVQTDEDTSEYRSTHRSPKRPGDTLNTAMPGNIFLSQVKRINPPDAKEAHVVISGKHTFAVQAKVVLRKIIVPRDTPTVVQERPPASQSRQTASPRPNRGMNRL